MQNDCRSILMALAITVKSIFCVHTSTVQFSGSRKRTPFTDPPTEMIKKTSQPDTFITSQTRALYRALSTETKQPRLARRHEQLSTFGVLRPVLFPLKTSACVDVRYTTSRFYRSLS
jgi:hypothetical protein